MKALIADPRLPGGRLPVPAELRAALPDPILSALITVAGASLRMMEDAATNAAILVAANEKTCNTRGAVAVATVEDLVRTVALRDRDITDLRVWFAKAVLRADRAEAARDAFKESKRGFAGMKAQVSEVHHVVVSKRASASSCAKTRVSRAQAG